MGTAARFNAFVSNIKLTAVEREDAKQKYDGVASKLHGSFYSGRYDGATKLLVGSYGKGTAIRPPRDIDMVFKLPFLEFSRYDNYSGNGQSALLQTVRSILLQRYPRTDIKGDGPVVVVPFLNGHTVEVLPGFQVSSGKVIIPETGGGGYWGVVDHVAEINNVASSDSRSAGNTRNLIKMMKVWQSYCNVPIKSLTLELRAVNFLANWAHFDKGTHYYDWMIRDYFAELIQNANNYCIIPGTEDRCSYGDAWMSKAQSAHARAAKACQAESDELPLAAYSEWQKIFGGQFEYRL